MYSISDLPNGSHTIRGVKKSGQFMLVDKLVVRQESLLNPGTAAFDKQPSAQADVSTEIGRDPGELAGIANGGTDLVKGTDYTVDGKAVTIKKAYLATQPTGTTKLDFRFRGDYRDDVHAADGERRGVRASPSRAPASAGSRRWLRTRAKPTSTSTASSQTRVNLANAARVTTQPVFNHTGLKDGPTPCAS